MKRRMTQSPPTDIARKSRRERKAAADAPRTGRTRSIAELMPDVGGAAFRKFGFIQSSIVTRWAEIAGPRHAALSAPESIRFPPGKKAAGTLNLVVASGHAPIMQHVLPDIVARVNRFFGYEAVAKIAMRQGDLPPAPRPATARPAAARPARPLPPDVGDGLRDIGDPELRAVLEAMASGLAGTSGLPRIG